MSDHPRSPTRLDGALPATPADLDELEHLSEQQGIDGLRVAAELIEDELRQKSPVRRAVELVAAVGITVLVFARVIPTWFGVQYAQVWDEIARVPLPAIAGLVALWLFTMWSYSGVLAHALPPLTRAQGMTVNFSGSALANVVPFGGAAGIGATYAQCLSWGFGAPAITLSILVTGVWNVFAKLGMPVVVLAALVAVGHATGQLALAAAVGLAVLALCLALFALVIRSERLAERVGEVGERAIALVRWRRGADAGRVRRGVLEFRHRTVGLVRRQWRGLTAWMVVYKVAQAMLQVLCARAVGIGADQVGWVELFAVFAFGELLSTIPLTPGGVGFVEAGAAATLVAFGAAEPEALAAVLLYRAFTYLFEIPLGGVGWLTWALRRSWRRPPGSRPDPLAGAGVTAAE